MIRAGLLAAALGCAVAVRAAESPTQILNLSCVEALVAVDQANLAGVFSFISEKDSPSAFGDLLVHNKKAMKKFLAKEDADLRVASGISAWDHAVLVFVLSIYGSPLAETLEKPASGVMSKLTSLVAAPTITLEYLTARRRHK